MRNREPQYRLRPAALGFLLVCVLAAGVVLALVAIRNNASCTVGASGSAASVTFTGAEAPDACARLLSGGHVFYQYEGTPGGNLVCAGEYRLASGASVHFVVRDTGVGLLSAGAVMCKSLQK